VVQALAAGPINLLSRCTAPACTAPILHCSRHAASLHRVVSDVPPTRLEESPASAPSNAGRLLVANCISLVTPSMVFATRGAITGPITEQFHLSNAQTGLIYGPSFWGFAIAIFICGLYKDQTGKVPNMLHAWWPGGMIIGR
jgi:hypothetical protein